jgi:4-amino-4-deoxy-L-arabinose transferase-like glycosyltransferase
MDDPMKTLLRDLFWILPSGLFLGLVLSLLGPGTWWIGWLAYALILVLGLAALSVLWRAFGASRTVGLMLLLTVILRVGLGMAFSYVLPAYGNDTPVQQAGYIFRDAYTRDTQGWQLASSGDSLLKAFTQSYSSDQYGGLLLLTSALYRYLSPDAQRPWLVILVGALVAAIGVLLAYQAANRAWGKFAALCVGWIIALYPEAILLGSSQMREPYLMTFIAMAFWGLLVWTENRRASILWLAGGVVGLLLFNSGVAVPAVVILGIWFWLGSKERHISWWVWVGGFALVAVAVGLFTWSLRGTGIDHQGILGTLSTRVRDTIHWDTQIMEDSSGLIQLIFRSTPEVLHLPFIIVYGVAQPVLPAAIGVLKGVWPMRALSILRGLGWYALLPFLLYSLRSVWKMQNKRERQAWIWLCTAVWIWVIVSSARAGGDQWDNPRYRAIFLLFQAALVANVITFQRAAGDRGWGRFLVIEAVFVVCFSAWTMSRYDANPGSIPLTGALAAFIGISVLVLLGDWLWVRLGRTRNISKRD